MIQFLQDVGCGILWIASAVLTIVKKNPIGIIILAVMHAAELFIIGMKTGIEYGKKRVYSIVMCMTFGFTWWLPLKKQMEAETFTDADFVRTDHDFTMPDTGVQN